MASPAGLEKLTGLASRFGAFVADRYPFALADALEAFEAAVAAGRDSRTESEPRSEAAIDALRHPLKRQLSQRLAAMPIPAGLVEPTPRVDARTRIAQARDEPIGAGGGVLSPGA